MPVPTQPVLYTNLLASIMMVRQLLSRKRTLKNPSSKKIQSFLALSLLLVFLASCSSQRPAVVTVKKREATTVTKAPDLAVVKAKPEPRKAPKPQPAKVGLPVEKQETLTTEESSLTTKSTKLEDLTIEELAIEQAETYLGVRYRYAGNSRAGIDCSGLMHESFKFAGITIPRTSGGIMNATEPILLDHTKPGDFVFFATGRGRARVSHVGLVTRVLNGDVEFIHASTSQGVIKSLLSENYWNNAFLRAGRLDR